MRESNPDLKGILPRSYTVIPNDTIASLLRHISSYTKDLEGDAFGLIYEYFLGKFALAEGQGAGLCKVVTIEEIEAQGWSLNPGRYVGTEAEEIDDEVFEEQLAESHAELRALGARTRELEDAVDGVLEQLLSEST